MTLINNENLLLQLATHQTALIRELRMSICTKKYAQKQVAKKKGGKWGGKQGNSLLTVSRRPSFQRQDPAVGVFKS